MECLAGNKLKGRAWFWNDREKGLLQDIWGKVSGKQTNINAEDEVD